MSKLYNKTDYKHYYNSMGIIDHYANEEIDTAEIRHILKCVYDRIKHDYPKDFQALSAAMTDYAFREFRNLYGIISTYEADISLGGLGGFVRTSLSPEKRLWFGILDRWYDAGMVPREFMLYANDLLMRAAIDILLGWSGDVELVCKEPLEVGNGE